MIGGGTVGVSQGVDFITRVRLGIEPHFQPIYFRGRNSSIDTTGVPADLWPAPGGVAAYPFQSAAVALQIASSSANDTAGGTGARAVGISGLDANWNIVFQLVTLAGTTPVALATSLVRVNELLVIAAGSAGSNIGTISLSAAIGGTVVAQVEPDDGVSFSGVYSVPDGHSLLMLQAIVSIQRTAVAAGAEVSLQIRNGKNGGAWFEPFSVSLHTQGTTTYEQAVTSGAIVGGWDLRARCRNATNNGTRLTIAVFGVLYDGG